MGILKLMFVVAVGCGVATTAQAQQIRVIAANPQGSIFYAGSVAIGKLIDDKLKMQVRVQPMAGSSTYIPLLNSGESDFGLTNVDDAVSSYKGIGSFRQANSNLRLIAAVFQLNFGILVPNDSPIKSIKDLRGKIMPWGYNAQVTGRVLQQAALASEGITMDDVKQVPTQSLFSGVDMLGEGKVEAAALAIGTAQVQRANVSLAARGGVRFLNVGSTPEATARIRKFLPARPVVVQPAPHAVGIVAPTTVIEYSVFFSTHAKMPDDIVYSIAKTIQGGKDDMMKSHPVFRSFRPEQMTEEIGVPWHPGAIKFYKEINQWPPKD
jgi:TRAP transporter TAXI family solute receptor